MTSRNPNSVETILNYDNETEFRNGSQMSVVWSTANIPGMDNASGGGEQGMKGRQKLRFGALALGSFMTMHCRVASSAVTGGYFIFMIFLMMMTTLLANPLRHFEVYLGQWSISGPGRAFRILPMFDGVGIAICINALVRATLCCTIAAISTIYVVHSVSDTTLPFTYCRDFNLTPYDPILKNFKKVMLKESKISLQEVEVEDTETEQLDVLNDADQGSDDNGIPNYIYTLAVCNETYDGGYPTVYTTPPYNFFYVEVVSYRSSYNFGHFNIPLITALVLVWSTLWIFLVIERTIHGRLKWNNLYTWLVIVPWVWIVILLIAVFTKLASMGKAFQILFRTGVKEILGGMADALEVAIYIHSASMGTELIHGKGLNHYASGHIDPLLNAENIWHSGLMLLMSGLHCGGAAVCAIIDSVQPNMQSVYNIYESTLWIIPMYSKCTLINNYSHLMCVLIFSGLVFSYMTVAYVLIKTALHTIFEYRVQLVFAEQVIVAALIISCMVLSLLFATTGGIAFLESVDTIMSGVAVPFVSLLELVAFLYVYRSPDFMSDMNVATEDNACATRISTMWQILPLLTLAALIIKCSSLSNAEMPTMFMYVACAPLAGVLLAVPLRALVNTIDYLRHKPKNTPRRN